MKTIRTLLRQLQSHKLKMRTKGTSNPRGRYTPYKQQQRNQSSNQDLASILFGALRQQQPQAGPSTSGSTQSLSRLNIQAQKSTSKCTGFHRYQLK